MLYDPNYMTFWESQNYGDRKKISGCQGSEGEWEQWKDGAQGIFRAVELFILYTTVMVDTYYTFVKTHRMYNINSEH